MIYGKIKHVDILNRTISLNHKGRQHTLYFQRAMFNKFQKFLLAGTYLVLNTTIITRKNKDKRETVTQVIKITRPHPRGVRLLYSFRQLQTETKQFINSLNNKLFLDFEMSMHPYTVDKQFVQEIIQVGYVLEDAKGNVLKRKKMCVKPTRHKRLSKRTLKFLDLTQSDVDEGVSYKTFYHHLKAIIEAHRPAIIVWGRNDGLSLNESYRLNQVKPLNHQTRFVNLLKLHKNYFHVKNDIGLKTAYEMYGHNMPEQRHDALEDAFMTRDIFHGFKRHMNDPENHPVNLKR